MYNSSHKFKFTFLGEQIKIKVTCTSILISQYIHFNKHCQNTINPYFNQQQQFGNYVPKYEKFERAVMSVQITPSYPVSLLQDMPVDKHLYSFEGMGIQN